MHYMLFEASWPKTKIQNYTAYDDEDDCSGVKDSRGMRVMLPENGAAEGDS